MINIYKKIKDVFFSVSIVYKISLSFIAVFLVLLVALTTITNKLSSDIIIKKTTENTFQNLTVISSKFDLLFDNVESYSKIAIINSNIQNLLDKKIKNKKILSYEETIKVKIALNNLIAPVTMLKGIAVFDEKFSAYETNGMNVNKEENYISQFSKSTDNARWINTHPNSYVPKDISHGNNILSYIRKIYSLDDGGTRGYLEIILDENYLANLYSQIKIGNSSTFFIIDENGNILSHPDKNMLYKNISNQPYYSLIKNKHMGSETTISEDKYLLISKNYTRLNWTIVGLVPEKLIMADNKILTTKIFLIGSVCILIAILVSFVLSLSITNPLIKLKRVVKTAGKGDLNVRVNISNKDEIGDLANEFNKMISQTKLLMDNIYDEQKKKREYELSALQAQINPHFLYNTLESICGLAYMIKIDELVDMVKELALFYRGVLSKGDNIIELQDEVDTTQRYLNILKIRYGDKFDYNIDMDLNLSHCKVIKLMLQPLVENAIYHGIKNKRSKGHVSINISNAEDNLLIVITDNGKGMTVDELESIFRLEKSNYKKKSFGVKSTDERIKLYFGKEYGLTISSIFNEGTQVNINLPILIDHNQMKLPPIQ